jgi:hypothetical protein
MKSALGLSLFQEHRQGQSAEYRDGWDAAITCVVISLF